MTKSDNENYVPNSISLATLCVGILFIDLFVPFTGSVGILYILPVILTLHSSTNTTIIVTVGSAMFICIGSLSSAAIGNELNTLMSIALQLFMLLFVGGSVLYVRNVVFRTTTDLSQHRGQGESQDHLKAALDGTEDGIITIDIKGYIQSINRAGLELFGYSEKELLGKNVKILMPENYSKHHDQYLRDYRQSGVAKIIGMGREVPALRKDGCIFPARLEVRPAESLGQKLFVGVIHDMTAELEVRDVLEKSEKSLQEAQRLAQVGSWTWNINSNTLHWSDEMYRLWSLEKTDNELTYDALTSGIHDDDRAYAQDAVDLALQGKKEYNVEYRVLGNPERHIHAMGSVERDEKGRPRRMFGTAQDITDRRLVEKELRTAKELADQANAMKSAFLANMSHEIRTPLNGVMGMAQFLDRTQLDAKQKKYCQLIRSSGQSLLEVIDDILDISKIEAGKISFENVEFDLEHLVNQALDSIAGVAIQKNLTIVNQCNCCGTYYGDKKRLKQVLLNLLGNAVKFTEEGSISLSVDRISGGALRFAVTDTGMGISENQQQQVFDRFTQADESSTRTHGGTGLGLAISKDLIHLMGGEIGVDSKLNEGSTFWFTITLSPVELSVKTGEASASTIENQQSALPVIESGKPPVTRVLIAEDNPVNQTVITSALEEVANVEFTLTENGAEVINYLDNEQFDLVLMDINMPIMTGDEAIRVIRSSGKQYANIPIVVLSANAMSRHEEEYLRIGATGYIAKPLDINRLIETVQQYTCNQIDSDAA